MWASYAHRKYCSIQHDNTKHVMLWGNPREFMAINVSYNYKDC